MAQTPYVEGYEKYKANSKTEVYWFSNPSITEVDIEYSLDGGNTWELVQDNIPSIYTDDNIGIHHFSGIFLNFTTKHFKLKIKSGNNEVISDDFGLSSYDLATLDKWTWLGEDLILNMEDCIYVGETNSISWNFNYGQLCKCIDGNPPGSSNINIKLSVSYDGGANWNILDEVPQSQEEYIWDSPSEATENAIIAIEESCIGFYAVTDFFTMTDKNDLIVDAIPSIVESGSSINLQWEYTGNEESPEFNLYYWNGTGYEAIILNQKRNFG